MSTEDDPRSGRPKEAVTDKNNAKLQELGFELLPDTLYSPDLAPSDFFLFSDLKRDARWKEILRQ